MQTTIDATHRTFKRKQGETPQAFQDRMNALPATLFRHLPDVVIRRDYGVLDGCIACFVHVEHAPTRKTARRSRRGGKRHRAAVAS